MSISDEYFWWLLLNSLTNMWYHREINYITAIRKKEKNRKKITEKKKKNIKSSPPEVFLYKGCSENVVFNKNWTFL